MVCQLVLLVVFVDYSRRVIHGTYTMSVGAVCRVCKLVQKESYSHGTDGMSVGAVGRVCRLFQKS